MNVEVTRISMEARVCGHSGVANCVVVTGLCGSFWHQQTRLLLHRPARPASNNNNNSSSSSSRSNEGYCFQVKLMVDGPCRQIMKVQVAPNWLYSSALHKHAAFVAG